MDMLLFEFLQELIFFKDAERLLLRVSEVGIKEEGGAYILRTEAWGETLDAGRHELLVDVKAVTLHRYRVEKTETGREASVILDT
jgi:SHS2 domain-containing protein